MPLIKKSTYKAPWYLFNGDLETIISGLFRKSAKMDYTRERFDLSDEDFIDIDWIRRGNDKLAVLLHGLEGNSRRHYIQAMAGFLVEKGWDILAFNCRSCSGEINRKFRLYHHGDTDDLREVLRKVAKRDEYQNIFLIGYSMGGSQLIKYLGEEGKDTNDKISGGIAISTPCDLKASAMELAKRGKKIYRKRFIDKLKVKIKKKAEQFPGKIHLNGIDRVRFFHELDAYTSVINGFKNADDFYFTASANNYIESVNRPVLLINAKNDPMLPESCFPFALAKDHKYFYLEVPERGGHCGFYSPGEKVAWLERRVLEFMEEKVSN